MHVVVDAIRDDSREAAARFAAPEFVNRASLNERFAFASYWRAQRGEISARRVWVNQFKAILHSLLYGVGRPSRKGQ